ncbi:MAG: hypothetical protein U0V70_17300 [Terriglobia bacterium]
MPQRQLLWLLQFEIIQNSIRTLIYKLSENRLTIFASLAVTIVVLAIEFRFLARKK